MVSYKDPDYFLTCKILGASDKNTGRTFILLLYSACNAGDVSSISGSGRCPGEGNGYPLQYSSLKSSLDRGAWWATVHRDAKSQAQLSD